MRSNHFSLGSFILLFVCLSTSYAQVTWTGGGTDWNDPASWSSNPSLPSFGTTIIIDGNSTPPGNVATVDVASSFTPGQISIINGGELIVNNTLDVSSDTYTYITGIGSRLSVNTGGLLTAEFITVTDGGAIKITGGELDVNDQLSMSDGTFDITGGLLDYNGGTGEEMLLTNSTFNMTGGTLEFHRGLIVTGGNFTLGENATMTSTNATRNLEFHDATADLAGTINNSTGDLSLFGTSVVNLLSTLSMSLDDLVLNDDGQSSTLNIYGAVVATDDLKFDEDTSSDIPGDNDQIIIKDGGSLDIQGTFRDIAFLESGNSIHVEDGGSLNIGILDDGKTPEEVYGSFVTSDEGATVIMEGFGPLPVELVYFEGSNSPDEGVLLKWATSVEINNDYFDLLRSVDGHNFEPIARIEGNGNTNQIIEYSFTDKKVWPGTHYYQLKQVDFNGEFEFLPIIRVEHFRIADDQLSVYPNPVRAQNFTLVSTRSVSESTLEIYTVTGKIIFKKRLDANINKWTIDRSELNISEGSYFLKLREDQSNQVIGSIKISVME